MTKRVVVYFVRNNLICRFGLPDSITIDNGANFNSYLMKEIYDQLKITHRNSVAYRPQMNGDVEAANKNLKIFLRKIIEITEVSMRCYHMLSWDTKKPLKHQLEQLHTC